MISRIYLACAGLVVVSVLWAWVMPVSMPEAREVLPTDAPAERTPGSEGLLDAIFASNLFSQGRGPMVMAEPEPEAPPPPPVQEKPKEDAIVTWRLAGVSYEGRQTLAVVVAQQGGQSRTEVYFPGDTLPGGERLVKVMPFGIQLEKSGEYENRYLFGKE